MTNPLNTVSRERALLDAVKTVLELQAVKTSPPALEALEAVQRRIEAELAADRHAVNSLRTLVLPDGLQQLLQDVDYLVVGRCMRLATANTRPIADEDDGTQEDMSEFLADLLSTHVPDWHARRCACGAPFGPEGGAPLWAEHAASQITAAIQKEDRNV